MKKLFLAVLLALVLFGCVSSPAPDTRIGELESKVQSLQIQYDASEDRVSQLQSSLDSTKSEKAAFEKELANAQAASFSQERLDKLTEAQSSLQGVSSNSTAVQAMAKYKDLDNFGCFYYIGSGGFYTSGNVTIPLGCILALDNYISASRLAVNSSIADYAKVNSALAAVSSARTG